MRPVEQYLRDLSEIRSAGGGTKETSYYGPLERLLNSIGAGLKPHVRCLMQLKSLGADHPDGGFFTADQYARKAAAAPVIAQAPARGAAEAKPTDADVDDVADSAQVRKYLDRYNQVLVTNFRSFLLVGRDGDGNPVPGERYDLAPSESEFWPAAGDALAPPGQSLNVAGPAPDCATPAPICTPSDPDCTRPDHTAPPTPPPPRTGEGVGG
jgi:hypothetical protein